MKIFESHAHYDDKQFDGDRDALLAAMQKQGIETVVNVGSTFEGCQKTLALTKKYQFVYGAVGIHPSEIEGLGEDVCDWIWEKSQLPKIVAIGEIGLDYYWEKDAGARQRQKEWFIRQLEVAREVGLPVIIHAEQIPGVVHCFSYSLEMAEAYLRMGYYIGIGGVVTFRNAKKVKEVAREVPLDRILLETDSPYLSPEPNRGKRNSSLNLPYVAEEIARIRGISLEEVAEATRENARRLFRKVEETMA